MVKYNILLFLILSTLLVEPFIINELFIISFILHDISNLQLYFIISFTLLQSLSLSLLLLSLLLLSLSLLLLSLRGGNFRVISLSSISLALHLNNKTSIL